MKVMRIITRMNGGGPVQQVVILNSNLDKFRSVLVYGSVSNKEVDVSYEAASLFRYHVPELQREVDLVKDIKAFWKIYKIIKFEQPDIIHTHTSKAGLLGRLAGILFKLRSKAKTRLFHTFHGNIFTGYFTGLKSSVIVSIERFLAKRTEKIIAISRKQKEELISYGIAEADKIMVIELGLELKELKQANDFLEMISNENKVHPYC